jgi:hypothetical protein
MVHRLAFALALVAASTAGAAPVCHLRGRPWLEGRVRSGVPARAVDARIGERIEVFLVAPGRLDGRAVLFSDDGRRGRVSWAHAGCGPMEIAWRRVEPRMEHVITAAPNKDVAVYANAVLFGPAHGAWIGLDRIEYFETPRDGSGPTLLVDEARPSDARALALRPAALQGLGVMRLAATVRADGQTLLTPGADDAPDGLISERVFRYSFRRGDDFLGWLTSYFNVPYLFGSAGKGKRSQAERYLGADCADVLVAALRRAGRSDLDYSSVADLVDALPQAGSTRVLPCRAGACAPLSPRLRFGVDVQPGDLLALDYLGADELPRDWDHIVALVEDRGPGGTPDGLLGPEDLVADSGGAEGLKLAPLGEQGTVRVMVLHPRH